MKLQIVQLEPYDDVVSVRDRLSFVQGERVLLVMPRDEALDRPILARRLDLLLIQREAARRGVWLALVTTNPDVFDVANSLNISAFPSVRASQRQRWKRPRNKVFIERSDRPADAPDPRELMLKASRLRVLSPRQRAIRKAARIGATTALILTVAVFLFLILPGAQVTIYPAQAQINTSLTLSADPDIQNVDVERLRIPAKLESIEISSQASIPTTGSADVPSSFARGDIVFSNLIESELTIPAGTIVSTSGREPARFATTREAVVAAGVGQEVRVPVQATDETSGARGNIEANLIVNIDGDLSDLLAVRNPEAMSGGSVREQSFVTRADYDNLLVLGRERVRQDALVRLSERLGGTQFVVPDSIEITNFGSEEVTYDAFVGDAADTLTITIRASVRALVVDEQSARGAALARLSVQIPPGRRLVLESIEYERGPVSVQGGQTTFTLSASGNVAAAVDAEGVRQRIAGMDVQSALDTLNNGWLLDPRRAPEIEVWPAILGRLPVLPVRINVSVEQIS
jgi:hypothetical protein